MVRDDRGMMNLNLGCGVGKMDGMINIDLYGNPDLRWDLNKTPYPFDENSVDSIFAKHVFEHLENWAGAFEECARILKPNGILEIRVPDESSSTALTFRDHVNIFGANSFFGIQNDEPGSNAWQSEISKSIPLVMVQYLKVPHKKYYWMTKWPFRGLLKFCSDHLRNFIWEQRFVFRKMCR